MGSGKRGGSQLAQLRSGLREAGVTGSKPKKGRKGQSDESRVGQYRAQQRRKRLESLMSGLNAFDERVAPSKNQALGTKVKGAVGTPAIAKSAGMKQRRAKLLPEYEGRHKTSSFVDRRFGEYNPKMSLEDKMLRRFTQERMSRTSKTSMFDLNDDDAELSLTHYGQSLSGLDNMPDAEPADDDDDDFDKNPKGQIDAATTRDAHFAGFDDESAPRSKHDVMKEVIAKSKLAKYERQKIKDADEELRMELDDELGNIRSLLFTQPNTEQSPSVPGAPSEQDKSDTYDAFVREMAYERRARPQDRLKSAEELAEEQAKRLHEAEAARLRRMRGEQDEEGAALLDYQMNEEEDDEAKIAPDDEPKTMRSRFGLGAGLDGLQQANANAETDEEDGDSEGEEDEEKNEVSEEEDEDEDDDNDNDEEDVSDTSAELADYEHLEQHGEVLDTRVPDDGVEHNDRHVAHTNTDAAPTLPFTFPCPSSHDAFLNLLEEHHVQPSQINTVVSRIRTLHAPNLAEENPAKLQRFLSVLVDHVLYRAGQPDTQADDLRILNDLVLHIYELAKSYPLRAAEHFVAKLALMQRNLMRGLAHGALDLRARTWPRLAELMFLRMCMILWPTSDKWHAVTTPMYLLMAQYLAHARTRSLTDMASALYLCSLVSSAQHASRRIVPEALNALFTVAAILLPQHRGKRMHGLSPVKALAEEFGIPTPDVEAEQTGQLVISADATPHSKMSLADVFKSQGNSTQIKADLLRMCVELMQSFAQLYKASSAFVEMFTPMLFLLEIGEASLKDTAPSLVPCVHEVVVSMRAEVEHAHNTRHALRLQAHRALSIASYAPKFEQQSFDPRRATDPDTERANAAKLRAMLKKERKGAIRELRKDAQFIAEERDQRRVAEDTSYKKKIDKIVGGIQSERSEEKQLDRAKALIRKRAGKR